MSTILRNPELALLVLFLAAGSAADTDFGGHGKLRGIANALPSDSIIRTTAPSVPFDVEGELRLNVKASSGAWRAEAAYSLFLLYGDRVAYRRDFADNLPLYPDDERRLFDLTQVFEDSGKRLALHRLDRLSIGYTSDDFVIRFGRQALSWGNGLFFSSLDLVNPFDPAAIDTEYKTGDDMLYAQRLFETGNDVQAAVVVRRNPETGNVSSSQSSALLKYHAFIGASELDILFGQHYDEPVFGLGLVRSVGGAVIRSDVSVMDSDDGYKARALINGSLSWVAFGKNMSGSVEYFYSGFGLTDDDLLVTDVAANVALSEQLLRGDLFSIGRHYLAGNVLVEMTPLLSLTPSVLANVSDGSALFQLIGQYSLSDNSVLLGSLNVPIGPSGTEFGGLRVPLTDLRFSTGPGVFVQFGGYF
ncbi:MAG: hypothetical protein QNJ05_03820 [Woeseiaceae bacterium]|nr:hypothetical protein [Woeseiaceae bacterium]